MNNKLLVFSEKLNTKKEVDKLVSDNIKIPDFTEKVTFYLSYESIIVGM